MTSHIAMVARGFRVLTLGMDPELRAYLDAQFAAVLFKLHEHDRKFEEHGRKLDEHGRKLDEHGRKLDEHGRKLDEHDRRFDLLAEALVRIEHRLERARIA